MRKNNKNEGSLLKILVILISVFALIVVLVYGTNVEDQNEENAPAVEESVPRENPEESTPEENIPAVEEPSTEEDVPEASVPEENTPPVEPDENNEYQEAAEAVELVRPLIDDSFGSIDHSLRVVDNAAVLVLNVSSYEASQGISSGSWYNLVENAKTATANAKAFLESQGNSSSMAIWVGDVAADNYYLCVMDGVVIYDVSNELLQ